MYDEVRGQWEERFERRYGFWRGFVDEQVQRYLDCGLYENGFARVRCPDCRAEYLLAFSCKTRELCPSCAARRAAATETTAHSPWSEVYLIHHWHRSALNPMYHCRNILTGGTASCFDHTTADSAELAPVVER